MLLKRKRKEQNSEQREKFIFRGGVSQIFITFAPRLGDNESWVNEMVTFW
jgi:hypothetical protein